VTSFTVSRRTRELGIRVALGSSRLASQAARLFGYLVVMCVVCLLACLVPARRAVAVDPIEALRAE
jgi:hypothetical protein